MRRSSVTAAALAMLFLFAPTAMRAQSPISLGLGGGVALPLSDFNDDVVPGWRALGTLAIEVPLIPLGLRIDGAYDRFNIEKALIGAAGDAGARRIASFTVNPTYRLAVPLPLISPYLIGGAGSYNVGCAGNAKCESATSFGWNAGVGLKFGALALHGFAEARYHHVNVGGVQYVPVTVGIFF
ncbi:MAG TPA: outer membrane beta-barrel protein [Gemmatimonadaceae bacterium]|nr:outer membrane beta-barrel protein [Gemmatimonadaceae bacterium]